MNGQTKTKNKCESQMAYILINHVPVNKLKCRKGGIGADKKRKREKEREKTVYRINYINLSYLLVCISIIIIVQKSIISFVSFPRIFSNQSFAYGNQHVRDEALTCVTTFCSI